MSNLRSDCRDLIAKHRDEMPNVIRVHFEAALHQIDQIEDFWHAATKAEMAAERSLDAWQEVAELGCTVQRNSIVGMPPWAVLDVDGECVATGDSAQDAVDSAFKKFEANEASEGIQ